ncbi:hypothetical protein EVAR_96055_1 [Eumeta japonica]|uniref:Uncharacterized protein n=1 Tax=Eumeta variegata TaxID=151549 RepID=A0A4C1W866_EUMVA|nr:hypothetical protein EVAR_96055_1 [Eumeta japonica]
MLLTNLVTHAKKSSDVLTYFPRHGVFVGSVKKVAIGRPYIVLKIDNRCRRKDLVWQPRIERRSVGRAPTRWSEPDGPLCVAGGPLWVRGLQVKPFSWSSAYRRPLSPVRRKRLRPMDLRGLRGEERVV